MNSKNIDVLRKILYAVETGGQVYGKQRYDAFVGAAANTPNEKAITIGAGQWYAQEAKRLLQEIQRADPAKFKKIDTQNIEGDLLHKNWSRYAISPTSAKAKCIVSIISSSAGIRCQDWLMNTQIREYAESITKTYGAMPDAAMMECINIIHQGGSAALKRVLGKTAKPYTAERIYAALCMDPADKSNNNQVGDYTRRQKKVYEMIKKYCKEEDMEKTAQDVLNIMRSWLGYSEVNGKFKQIIDLYNSVKPLPRGYAVKYTDEWCDTTVSAAGIKAGCSNLIGRECGCEEHINIFKEMGIWIEDGTITPKAGDIILYNWDTKAQPNNGYSDHIGYVESVSNGQITCIEGNKGEAVARRVISVGNGNIRGYARPKYSGTGTAPNVPNAPSKPTTPPASGGGSLNKNVAWYGAVNTGTLKVRTWAGSENPQLKSYPTLTQGTKVGVCETIKDKSGDAWYYVKITGNQGEKYGFVAAEYITKQTTSKPNTEMKDDGVISKTPQWTGKVTADVLNVRSWAGTNNPLIRSWPKLNRGNLVDVCDVVNATDGSRWYYIRIAGKYYGFVSAQYIKQK